jgi:RecB family exonuclease
VAALPAVHLVQLGQGAQRALRDAIVDAKAGDPLAPVTVAVPSNYAGLSLRGTLGFGQLSLDSVSGREGLVNVRFLVLARIAELLGAPLLAAKGKRPLTAAVRAEAVRAVLSRDPGPFAEVLDHTSTERSLDSTFRDLRLAGDAAFDRAASLGERAQHVLFLFASFRDRTAAFFDEQDLFAAATEATTSRLPALNDIGRVVLYLPGRLSTAELEFVRALGASDLLTTIVGLTGDELADRSAHRIADELDTSITATPTLEPAPHASHIVAVTDAEEEVRTAIRLILQRLEERQIPLHRMAVLYTTPQPYALLTHEQFQAAGVPHNGGAVRTLAQSVAGRTLLAVLRLRDGGLRRDQVMDWLNGGPILEAANGRPAPAQRWDALSRLAGVIKGGNQWAQRLKRLRASLEEELEEQEHRDEFEWRIRRLRVDIGHAERLDRFIRELEERTAPSAHTAWRDFAAWGRSLLQRYLGARTRLHGWPEPEIEAYQAVEAALDALSTLGDIGHAPDEPTFRRALERALEAPASRIGKFGDGVFTGRLRDAAGADFDVVFVIGMSEGLLPSRHREDPLLVDAERDVAHVPPRSHRREDERRHYLSALATARERVLIFPRGDIRGQRGRLPARWLLESASKLAGRPLFSAEMEDLSEPWYTIVPSFESAVAGRSGEPLAPASIQEYDLRSLLRWQQAGHRADDHYLMGEHDSLNAGLAAGASRQQRQWTRWDGQIRPEKLQGPLKERTSATALQHWATCPFRYFLGHILRVNETIRPEDTLTLTPLERGNLIHKALETFISEQPSRESPWMAWMPTERARLIEIGDELCDQAEAAGLTGRPLLWQMQRAQVMRDLQGFLDADETLRREHGITTASAELSFGFDEQDPVRVPNDRGETITFRGRIDRLDVSPGARKVVVIDYKSGKSGYYKRLPEEPFKNGQLLQLPVYGLAAKTRYPDAAVEAYYWFVSESEDYRAIGYPVDDGRTEDFRHVVEVIANGIQRGVFPARPGAPTERGTFENCRLCPYDRACPRDRLAAWQRKRHAPELQEYLELCEPMT